MGGWKGGCNSTPKAEGLELKARDSWGIGVRKPLRWVREENGEGNVVARALKPGICMSVCPFHVGFSLLPVADMGRYYVGALCELTLS